MLLRDAAFAVMHRSEPYAIHYLQNVLVDPTASGDSDVTYDPTKEYSPNLSADIISLLNHHSTNANALAKAWDSLDQPCNLWLFIDEAQLLYANQSFWNTLCSLLGRRVYIVAAGSYGSHTGSASHSPSPDIFTTRINLFPSNDSSLCLAFTKADFDAFVETAQAQYKVTIETEWQIRIMKYASPYPYDTCWEGYLHPGVAAELIMFIITLVCVFSYFPLSSKPCTLVGKAQ